LNVNMKKNFLILALFIFLVATMAPIIVEASVVGCCKLVDDLYWSNGKIYSGTVYNNGTSVSCTASSPCDCSDEDDFPTGCHLTKNKTVGPAEEDITCEDGNPPYYKASARGMICLLNGVKMITNWFSIIIMVLATAFLVWGLLNIIISGGATEKITTGKNYIIYALIAFFIAALAKIVPSIMTTLMGF
jgi:hypothetical protein